MKRLSKLFLSIFALSLWFMGAYSHADATWMTITLTPWWNVVSTPALLSNISFSNWGDGISFSKLGSGLRVSIVPSIETLKPLEWFLVENTNSSDVDMILTYSDNVPPAEAIFQKNLDLWRNFLGITTNVNPFNNIVWNVNMTMDFTYSSSENLLNSVNSSYAWNQNSSTIVSPQYWEAYWAFITSNNAIYWWINNKDAENGISDPNWFGCTMEELMACALDDDSNDCLSLCRNRWVDITIWNNISQDQISAPWEYAVVLLDLTIMTQENLNIQKYELSANPELDFSQFTDWKVTLLINDIEYEITGSITNFSSQQDYFSINLHNWANIKVIWNILDENEFLWTYTPSNFEFKIKQVKNLELDKEISWLNIKWSWHTTNIFWFNLDIHNIPWSTTNYIRGWQESDVLSFSIKTNNQTVQLKEIKMTINAENINGLSGINEVDLYKSDWSISTVENEAFIISWTTAEITFYTINHSINPDTTENYVIKATLNNGTIIDLWKMLTFTLEDIKYTPILTSEDTRASIHGYTNLIEKNYVVINEEPEITVQKNGENIWLTIQNNSIYGIEIWEIKYRILCNYNNSTSSCIEWTAKILDTVNGIEIWTSWDFPWRIFSQISSWYWSIQSNGNYTYTIHLNSNYAILPEDYTVNVLGLKYRYIDSNNASNWVEVQYNVSL
mgnify:CR=1 FL=1